MSGGTTHQHALTGWPAGQCPPPRPVRAFDLFLVLAKPSVSGCATSACDNGLSTFGPPRKPYLVRPLTWEARLLSRRAEIRVSCTHTSNGATPGYAPRRCPRPARGPHPGRWPPARTPRPAPVRPRPRATRRPYFIHVALISLERCFRARYAYYERTGCTGRGPTERAGAGRGGAALASPGDGRGDFEASACDKVRSSTEPTQLMARQPRVKEVGLYCTEASFCSSCGVRP